VSDLISRTARLVPYAKRPKHAASFATAYLHEPAANESGSALGNLYIVVEVLISGRASEEVVDLVISTVGDKYYNDQSDNLIPLSRFENAIKQVNHELSEYVGRGNAAWIGKISAIIAVQIDQELHVAQTGSGEAFLYRGKAVSRISLNHTDKPATPSKTFGSIATGELEIGDKLLIATPALIHQIPLNKLQQVIASTSPNTAIQEVSQLLEGSATNRIAALITEITTPELAALKVRSEEPAEIELGNGENLAETARSIAAPIAQSTVLQSKKAARVAAHTYDSIQPKLRELNLVVIRLVRRVLTTKKGRRNVILAILLLIAVISVSSWRSNISKDSTRTFEQYHELYGQYASALTLGDKTLSHQRLTTVQASLKNLSPKESLINTKLKNNPLSEGEPTSYSELVVLVNDQIDLLDGLVKVSPLTVAEIGGKSGKPTHFEIDGTHAYVIDAANKNTIAIVDLSTGNQTDSSADTSGLGDVVNTTLSANNDGFYILTAKPSVWFYRFAGNSLSEQTLAYGTWPKSSAIASYGSNLYLLGSTTVYKQVHNASGYSPKNDYIATQSSVSATTGLAVDGWVYVASNVGVQRYLGSTLKQTAVTPNSLGVVTDLRSIAGGTAILGTSSSSLRLGLWKATDTSFTFEKQIAFREGKLLYDATYDQKQGKVFATVDDRLVSFDLKL
jgi:hypothetical protein